MVNRIGELVLWFEETVVNNFQTILSGMQVKLKSAVEMQGVNLLTIKGWFVKDAISGISKTLEATQESVEQVSEEVNKSLKTLREWFQGEAINQLGVALTEIEEKVGHASDDVVNGFGEMQKWVSNDVIITIKSTLESVTSKVTYASDAINQEVANLREIFSKRVVGNTFEMLTKIEDELWDSEATMKAFWDRALESGQRFEEVFFVQGADAMVGEIAMISERVKSKLFIVAPEIEDYWILFPLKYCLLELTSGILRAYR